MKMSSFHQSRKLIPIQSVSSNSTSFSQLQQALCYRPKSYMGCIRKLHCRATVGLWCAEDWTRYKEFSLARAECLTLITLSLGWSPANRPIAINDISLKTRCFGLHFRCRKYWCIFNHFYFTQSAPKAAEFGEITMRWGLLRCPRLSSLVPMD